MKPWTFIALAALQGCALSPSEVREQGSRHEREARQAPAAAARCIARNAENRGGSIAATERAAESGGMEVIVRSTGEGAQTLAAAMVSPRGAGSGVVIHVTPNMLASHEHFADSLVKGC